MRYAAEVYPQVSASIANDIPKIVTATDSGASRGIDSSNSHITAQRKYAPHRTPRNQSKLVLVAALIIALIFVAGTGVWLVSSKKTVLVGSPEQSA